MADIPKECKGAVVVDEGPNFRVEVRNVAVPEIGPEDVLIKINATGLCMSDVHFMSNDWGIAPMSYFGTQCAGHEGAGVIVKVGERVKRLKVGQRAGFKPIAETCGWCDLCISGQDQYCAAAKLTGFLTDGESTGYQGKRLHANAAIGTYKQYLRSPEAYTTLIPDGVPDHIAGPVMCSASTMYSSLKESGLRPGDWAVFVGGGGGVGIQGVQLASAMGIRPIVVDSGREKRKVALEYGAEAFLDFKESKNVAAEAVATCGGIGAHGVFVTAGEGYPTALSFLGNRVGGKVMCVALPTVGLYPMNVNAAELITKKKSISGTMVSSMADVHKTLEFAQRGILRLRPEIVGLSKFNDAVQRLKKGEVAGRIVVDFNLE
ncbi:hypothetical protein AYO21_08896 [Fonsecaea monophora]|uniref:Enoyl reductase (ER) domain-containing protein n=1 Tax=Fonsecaea monophora TaxID=254056 RepID=A0A177EY25_9EURO|nr:hypothetical protein AYO21_08896 [Fonsecaea monophora]KAH0827724.1 Alcohol dehydrogenase 1 [Fonsecaea pedrosoi]OAG36935.1 hypothetical protein AYO21_08896 [Fonsecaea monophora]